MVYNVIDFIPEIRHNVDKELFKPDLSNLSYKESN